MKSYLPSLEKTNKRMLPLSIASIAQHNGIIEELTAALIDARSEIFGVRHKSSFRLSSVQVSRNFFIIFGNLNNLRESPFSVLSS